MNELADNLPTVAPQGAVVQALTAREAQEVQALVISAKRFPRDQRAAFDSIMQACARPSLAEEAEYAYPRGGETVCGPTIRLLEVCAQNWGNIKSGFKILSSTPESSEVEVFAWDLQTNAHESITIQVRHVRDSKSKGKVPVTDERDIYEVVANVAARRKRKCLEGLIPGDIVEAARQECAKTLGTMAQKKEKVLAMVKAFQVDFRVTPEDIERRIGKRIEAMTTPEFIQLKKIFVSLRDKMSQVTDWFPQVLDPEKIKKSQSDAEVPPHAGNQAAVDAERKVALQEFNTALAFLEDKGWPIEEIEKKLRKPIAEVRKGDVKALQYATDLIKD